MKPQLSQKEMDDAFEGSSGAVPGTNSPIIQFDFTRLDRIPKSQIRAVHHLHENFVRDVASSLSAYLRTTVSMNLVSMEQISYAEFLEGLSTPTFIAYLGTHPYDATAVMEITPGLAFAVVEILLGGAGKSTAPPARKISDIEKELMQNLTRVLLRGLHEAWKSVADIDFAVQSVADEPYVTHVLAPGEAVVATGIEVRLGPATEMINLAIPSIFVKQLRHMFDRLQKVQHAESKPGERVQMAELLRGVNMNLEVRLEGAAVLTRDLLGIDVGDVLLLEHPAAARLTGLLNGQPRYWGHLAQAGPKKGVARRACDHAPAPSATARPRPRRCGWP